MLAPWKKSYDKLSILKSRDITLPTKVHLVKAMVFPVVMYPRWELNHKEVWAPKNSCLNCGVGEDSWEPLGLQGDPTSPSERDQSWLFIGRTDAEAETPILWPPDTKNWLTGKDPDAGKDLRWEEKGTTEDEMFGWHHKNFRKLWEIVKDRQAWCAAVHGVPVSWT